MPGAAIQSQSCNRLLRQQYRVILSALAFGFKHHSLDTRGPQKAAKVFTFSTNHRRLESDYLEETLTPKPEMAARVSSNESLITRFSAAAELQTTQSLRVAMSMRHRGHSAKLRLREPGVEQAEKKIRRNLSVPL